VTLQVARAASASRLEEIQHFLDRHGLPDSNWAEEILRGPGGVYAQAYRVSQNRVTPITDVIWVPERSS